MDTFGDIRSLLQHPPSTGGWERLCALLDDVPKKRARDVALPYALDHLGRWPDTIRRAPWRWLVSTITERPPLAWPIVRHVSFSPAAPLNNSWTERVAGSEHLVGITRLSLINCHLGGEKLYRVLNAPCMPELEALDLSFNHVRDDGLRGITRAYSLERLRELALSNNGVMFHGVKFIGDSPWWPGLRSLELGHNHLNPQAIEALAKALQLTRLENLDLRANAHGVGNADSLEALSHSPGAASLVSLDLSQNSMGAEHIRAIASSPHLGALRHIDLSGRQLRRSSSPLTPDDCRALRESTAAAGLHELSLAGHRLDDECIAALVEGDELRELRRLDLRFNTVSDAGAAAISQAFLPRLTRLDLGYNRVSSRGARALARADHLAELRHLDLFANSNVSDADADALRHSDDLPLLTHVTVGQYESDTA